MLAGGARAPGARKRRAPRVLGRCGPDRSRAPHRGRAERFLNTADHDPGDDLRLQRPQHAPVHTGGDVRLDHAVRGLADSGQRLAHEVGATGHAEDQARRVGIVCLQRAAMKATLSPSVCSTARETRPPGDTSGRLEPTCQFSPSRLSLGVKDFSSLVVLLVRRRVCGAA